MPTRPAGGGGFAVSAPAAANPAAPDIRTIIAITAVATCPSRFPIIARAPVFTDIQTEYPRAV